MIVSFVMRARYLLLLFPLFMIGCRGDDYGDDHNKAHTTHYDTDDYIPPKPPAFDDERGAQVTTLPPNPVYSVPGGMTAESFPADRPQATKSSLPPPESSAGRWLHTACWVPDQHEIIIYGGVSSYTSRHLLNDIWVKKNDGWSELQGSFVARLPYSLLDPKVDTSFRPDDVPAPPPMETTPGSEITAPLNPNADPGNPARFAMKRKAKVRLVELQPIPFNAMNRPGYVNFVEEEATVTRATRDHANPPRRSRQVTVPTRLETIMLQLSETEPPPAPGYFKPGEGYSVSGESMPATDAQKEKQYRPDPNPNKVPFAPDDLWSYDIYTLTWKFHQAKSTTAERPAVRWMHSATPFYDEGKTKGIFIFGGASFAGVILSDAWQLDVTTKEWTKINWAQPTYLLPRQGHTCVQADAKSAYCYGGVSYGYEPLFDVLKYDAQSKKMEPMEDETPFTQRPPGRWLHAAAWYAGRMFIFGGITHDYVPLNDLLIWDSGAPKDNKWTRLKTNFPPSPRGLASSTLVGSKLIIFGGMTNNLPLQDMWSIDLAIKDKTTGKVDAKPKLAKYEEPAAVFKWNEELPFGAFPFAREGGTLVTVKAPGAASSAPSGTSAPTGTSASTATPLSGNDNWREDVANGVDSATKDYDKILKNGGERDFKLRNPRLLVKRTATLDGRKDQRKDVDKDEIILLFGGASNVNQELVAP